MEKYAVVFPGQGAQKQGMGTDLFEISGEIFDKAESVYPNFKSILNKTNEELSNTIYSQPALFVVSVAIWDALKDTLKPEYIAGHSIGEYAACYAAGCINFEDALKLVKIRSELMAQCSGTMFACIGAFDDVEKFTAHIREETGLICEVANYNHEAQIVISCDENAVEAINKSYKEFGIKRCIQLKVSGGFHSSLVASCQEKLAAEIISVDFQNATIPLISNKTGVASTDANVIKANLIDHVVSSVKWTNTMSYMKENDTNMLFELGVGNVLSKLAEKSGMKSVTINHIDAILELKKGVE